MMNAYLNSITPDSLSGIILAAESVRDSLTLLNGPTGCKFYHGTTVDALRPITADNNPMNYREKWYFGQPRVPCTYMDSHDYIYGSEEKLVEALEYVRGCKPQPGLVTIVNSPGAALIGDDLQRIAAGILQDVPLLIVQSPGFSQDHSTAFDRTMCRIVRLLEKKPQRRDDVPTVNLLGISIYDRNHQGSVQELVRLLGLCGIRVLCAPGCDAATEDLSRLGEADLNVVICPEYAAETARQLELLYGTPSLTPTLQPIGFAATEACINAICERLGADNSEFMRESERARATAYAHIRRLHSISGLPTGVGFAVEGLRSQAAGYAAFLARYFGMVLLAANILEDDNRAAELPGDLDEFGFADACRRDVLECGASVVLGSGLTVARLRQRGAKFCGIETALPSLGYIDIIPKTHIGISGALQLTEAVLNALPF